eukprot:SAG31_NODE_3327_length_4408_cov_2.998669_2_plen_168_part_00
MLHEVTVLAALPSVICVSTCLCDSRVCRPTELSQRLGSWSPRTSSSRRLYRSDYRCCASLNGSLAVCPVASQVPLAVVGYSSLCVSSRMQDIEKFEQHVALAKNSNSQKERISATQSAYADLAGTRECEDAEDPIQAESGALNTTREGFDQFYHKVGEMDGTAQDIP